MSVSEASNGTPANGAPPSDRAFDYKGYRYYWVARFLLVFAWAMQFVVIEWEVYTLTRDPLSLGRPARILVLINAFGYRARPPPWREMPGGRYRARTYDLHDVNVAL